MTISVECDAGGRHEFEVNYNLEGDYFHCAKCGLAPRFDDILPMLNAAMQLTADRARNAAAQVHGKSEREDLWRYSHYWRGETDG